MLTLILTMGTLGLLSPYLSNVVERDLGTVGQAVTLVVGQVPSNLSAGDIFTLEVHIINNARRPLPSVLRMEVRNADGITPADITVHAMCGAEEQWNSRVLRYYIGWQGPLLAPNGTSFSVGTSVATVESVLGDVGHWDAVLREVQGRDPAGYEALIHPGHNASEAIRTTPSSALKVLNYYGMVAGDQTLEDPGAWHLTLPFTHRWVSAGNGSPDGFQVEVSPNARGAYSLKLWAERPDGLGIPNHPWRCGPL